MFPSVCEQKCELLLTDKQILEMKMFMCGTKNFLGFLSDFEARILRYHQILFLRQLSLVFGPRPTPECDFVSRFLLFFSPSPASLVCTPCSFV